MLRWCWHRFEALDPAGLYELMALRQAVFVVEQHCAYLDADGVDAQAWHLRGLDGQGRLCAYLRLVDPGVKYAEPSIGRVLTSPAVRGRGAGRALMAEAVAGHQRLWPGRANRISAQAHLLHFYEEFGYAPCGQPYLEDDIPHQEMLRPAAVTQEAT